MCDGEVDLGRLGGEHGVDPEVYFAREIAELGAAGSLRELAGYDHATRTVRTTSLGRLLVRNVCMVFDRYHREAQRASEASDPPAARAAQPQFSSTI
jgi:oxygen-independent coproporphyrinogen-3 oxidase